MRKSLIALLLGLQVIATNPSHALGLGDIDVYSALNQPLEAEIAITSVRPGETDGMIVKLASEQAFAQARVDRPYYLTKLLFELATRADGTPYIKVSTKDSVREPFISFLVDIDWPRGRLVREYTLLLDPPVFASSQPAVVSTTSLPEFVEPIPDRVIPNVLISSETREPAAITRREPAVVTESGIIPETPEATSLPPIVASEESFLPPIEVAEFQETIESGIAAETEKTIEKPLTTPDFLESEYQAPLVVRDLISEAVFPQIVARLDTSLPYDEENTKRILAEFDKEDGRSTTPIVNVNNYTVKPGETLGQIAGTVKAGNADISQVMLAILRQNPDAFIRNNINDVKKGVVLRIPDSQTIQSISKQEAATEVQRQTTVWREYKEQYAGARAVAPSETAGASTTQNTITETTASESTQLSLLAPGRDALSTTRASGEQKGTEEGRVLKENLLLAQESLAAEKLRKVELQERVTALTGQIETMQKLVSVKDQKLAELQAKLIELEKQKQTANAAVEASRKAAESAIKTEKPSIAEIPKIDKGAATQINPTPATELKKEAIPAPQATAEAEIAIETTSPPEPEVTESRITTEETPVEAIAEPIATNTAITKSKKKGEFDFITDYLPSPLDEMVADLIDDNGILYVGGGFALVLLGGVWLVLRKKKTAVANAKKGGFLDAEFGDRDSDDVTDDFDDIGSYADDLAEPELTKNVKAAADEFDAEKTVIIKSSSTKPSVNALTSDDEEISDDTTAEVDVYLAYGLFDQAEDLLKQALADNPGKKEYMGKLLETYFTAQKRADFETLASKLKELTGGKGRIWSKAVAMGKELAPSNTMFSAADSDLKASDFAPSKPMETDFEINDEDTDTFTTDFDLGDDSAGDETLIATDDMMAAVTQRPSYGTPDDNDLDLDLDLDFNADDLGLEEIVVPAQDFDLDIDEDLTLTGSHKAVRLPEETIVLNMDMDMDLDQLDLTDDGLKQSEKKSKKSKASDDLIADLDRTMIDNTVDVTMDSFGTDETLIDTQYDSTLTEAPSDEEEINTKLEIAREYINMGDNEGASSALQEVIADGNASQRKEAKALMQQIA